MMPWIAILIMVMAALFGFHLWRNTLPYDTTVPSMAGLRAEEAKREIARAGLLAEEPPQSQMSETVPEGSVISSSPSAGRRVKSGRRVNLVISSGSAFTVVPDVTQLPQGAARDRLSRVDLYIGSEEYVPHKTIPFDRVIAMTPKPGTRVKRYSTVNLKVSQGIPTDQKVSLSGLRSTVVTATLPKDDAEPAEVRIDVTDDDGTRTVYREERQSGETVVETVQGNGPMTIEVFFADQLILTRRYP
ncbi:MAG: PASTA domain-containing protein [Armatimonadota bacterium]